MVEWRLFGISPSFDVNIVIYNGSKFATNNLRQYRP